MLRGKVRKLKSRFKKRKKKRIGRWCEYYSGRLPYPINCQSNAVIPLCHDKPNCKTCERKVHFQAWKFGYWEKIKYAINQGEDLTDMEAPNQEIR